MMDAPKKKTDWEAVERDYRATNLTLRELADKHGCHNSSIAAQIKRHGWTRDLSAAVKQATNAALIEHDIQASASKHKQDVSTVVLAMAEVNKQVLLDHRERLIGLMDMVELARGVVQAQSANINDIKDAAILVQAVNGLSNATKNLIEKERENYKLNDAPPDPPKPKGTEYALDGFGELLDKAIALVSAK